MAIVKKYRSEVVDIQNPFTDIYTVSLKSLDKPYKYLPGQFLHLALDEYDPSSQWPESRCFSMQSSEQDETVKITYSIKGAFTQRMAQELKPGKEIVLKLPYGELFTKPHQRMKVVFIAGGTGVTPFLSLFTSRLFQEYENPKLYLGIKDSHYHIYREELSSGLSTNPGFEINEVYQDKEGMLDIKNIFQKNGKDSLYFISGPPVMIRNFKIFLSENGVHPDNIRTDDWE